MPLVEVVGGRLTSEDAVNKALTFYRSIGKKPIHIRREVKGHVANRLQAALWREAFYLLEQGIASVEDVDTAIAYGPGLRSTLQSSHGKTDQRRTSRLTMIRFAHDLDF